MARRCWYNLEGRGSGRLVMVTDDYRVGRSSEDAPFRRRASSQAPSVCRRPNPAGDEQQRENLRRRGVRSRDIVDCEPSGTTVIFHLGLLVRVHGGKRKVTTQCLSVCLSVCCIVF